MPLRDTGKTRRRLMSWPQAPSRVFKRWLSRDLTGTGANRPQHPGQSKGAGLAALDRPARDRIGGAAGVHANHRLAQRRKRAEKMRRERAAFAPGLDEPALETLQGGVDYPGARVSHPRQTILPASSTTHIAVPLPPTSSPANMVIAALLSPFANHQRKLRHFRQRAATFMYGMYKAATHH